MVTVKFQQGTPTGSMTRDELVTWLLGSVTRDRAVSGTAGMAVSHGVNSLVNRVTRMHDTDQCLAVSMGYGAEKWQVTCTRTGKRFHRSYAYRATRTA